MIEGTCHCGAVRVEVERAPEYLSECNCSICRRLGNLWTPRYDDDEVHITGEDETFAYRWGDRMIAFHACRTCGVSTHYRALAENDRTTRATKINARIFDPQIIKDLRIRHFDGATSWEFLD
ncbi:MAG: GFA family protein [Caulobacteraceae bacterium]